MCDKSIDQVLSSSQVILRNITQFDNDMVTES